MGFKTFTTTTLPASDVNNYLMKQAHVLCDIDTPPEEIPVKLAPYIKAAAAGVVALAGYLAGVIPAAGGFDDVTVQQWLGAVVTLGAVYGVTYRVPYVAKPASDGKHAGA